jgi:anaerobic carbon-monoxide dehydrogenase iron sulfur subunit
VQKREKALRRIILHPEKCTGCLQCMMVCSLRYEGLVNPLKARTRLVRNDIVTKIEFTPECTGCGACAVACHYGARELEEVS